MLKIIIIKNYLNIITILYKTAKWSLDCSLSSVFDGECIFCSCDNVFPSLTDDLYRKTKLCCNIRSHEHADTTSRMVVVKVIV